MLVEGFVGPAHGRQVLHVVGVARAALIDAEAAVDDRERAGAARRAAGAEDRRQVPVGELDDLGELVEADAGALPEQRMIVAAVEVHAPPRELVEARRALLGREDQATVEHEGRRELLIEQERELPDRAAACRSALRDVEVGVEPARIGRRALRALVVEGGGVRDVAARRREDDASVGAKVGSKLCTSSAVAR